MRALGDAAAAGDDFALVTLRQLRDGLDENKVGLIDQLQRLIFSAEATRTLDRDTRALLSGLDMGNQAVHEYSDGMGRFAGTTEEASQAIQEYLEWVGRATNPILALDGALRDVEEAQDDYNEAVKEYGADSTQAQAAAMNMLTALNNLEAAALDGDISFSDFSDRLDTWVANGRLTEEMAATIRDRVRDELVPAVDEFDGTRRAVLEMTESGSLSREARRLLSDTGIISRTVQLRIQQVGQSPRLSNGQALVMHSGGWVTGPEREPLIKGERGEFMVNARAAQANAGLLEAINSGGLKSAPTSFGSDGASMPTGGDVHLHVTPDVLADQRTMFRARDLAAEYV